MFTVSEKDLELQVGVKIRELRMSKNLKAMELAQLAGISQAQLSKIENGKVKISIQTICRLSETFDRPLSYFFDTQNEIPLTLGTMSTIDGPEKKGVEWFSKKIEQQTDGSITITPMMPSQLGSSREQIEILRKGAIDLFIGDAAYFQKFFPVLSIFCLPYLFETNEHMKSFLESKYFDEIVKKPMRQYGVRIINRKWNWFRGIEWCLVCRKPIVTPDQVRGLRVRIPESKPAAAWYWEQLGAIPITVPWHLVKEAFEKKEFDLLSTFKSYLYPLGFCEYAKYVTLLGDICGSTAIAMNEQKYKNMHPTDFKHLEEACTQGGDYFSKLVETAEIENEKKNMAEYSAAYLTVDTEPWREEANRAQNRCISKGRLPQDVFKEIDRLRPE
jgi:TRAP-type C4-dicarboxylate transport system substrate-binding protein/DNA-binding Xre family transcriptional regulator